MITALAVTGAVLLLAATAALAAWRLLFRDPGQRAGPHDAGLQPAIGAARAAIRAARSAPPHPRAMFGPGAEGPSVPLHLPPAERRH